MFEYMPYFTKILGEVIGVGGWLEGGIFYEQAFRVSHILEHLWQLPAEPGDQLAMCVLD